MTSQEYVYKVIDVVKVTDGDTYWLRVDVGFRGNLLINARLAGYDTPEAHKGSAYEKAQAIVARSVATEFLSPVVPTLGSALWIRSEKDPDDFGRWLCHVWRETPTSVSFLGEKLRSLGLASKWPTRWHEEFDSVSKN